MTELRFHRELYAVDAVDEAIDVYGRFASFEVVDEPTHRLVRVTASSEPRERRVCHEFSNYALGLTIKGRQAS